MKLCMSYCLCLLPALQPDLLCKQCCFASPPVQALILAPTRELARQIDKEAKNFAGHVGVRSL